VLADPVQLQQVVLNLLRNAMEAMADPGCTPRTILVSARSVNDDCVEIAVRDRGIGISSDVERQLFTTFYSTKESGLGMGLPISRSILDAHGGDLGFTRNEDRGTTFRISLPAVSGDIDEEEPSNSVHRGRR
jgi:two-component system sensor kinase FixL